MLASTDIRDKALLHYLAYIIIAPLTPKQFRTLIGQEDDFLYIGMLFDSHLRNLLRKNKRMSPLVAEAHTMMSIKKWWLANLSDEVKQKLQQAYYEGMPIFIINLSRNFPYGTNNPWQCMKNGCPRHDLPRLLKRVLSPEAANEIVHQIDNEYHGKEQIYEVRIAPDKPGSNDFSIAVVPWKAPS